MDKQQKLQQINQKLLELHRQEKKALEEAMEIITKQITKEFDEVRKPLIEERDRLRHGQ